MKREGIIKRTNDDELTDEYGSLRYQKERMMLIE